ncbi:phosphodiester glycosidase family protein [Paenibacillus assamensis]|uniref:phosphodiester glycosidase family protein n=1 Tax=Paenibacillus assamensis TaxID=311244 RepID=UPI00041FF5A9|nr:phosphodiester glycosidase family protein [Paenibacillus assamensis]
MTQVKRINRIFMMAVAPFIGMMIFILISSLQVSIQLTMPDNTSFTQDWNESQKQITQGLTKAQHTAEYTMETVGRVSKLYQKTTNTMNSIVNTASAQAKRPEQIYNRRITAKLGTPMDQVNSDKLTAELYRIGSTSYNGYAMKVKLKSPDAMKMTLGNDKFGGTETTMQAAQRYSAIAGVNAGGYADGGGGRYPLGTTVMNGKYVGGFHPSFKDLTFVGFNKEAKLIGGKFYSQYQLDKMDPHFGASFVPQLLHNGVSLKIPEKWASSRAPRTVIGNYKDDQLLIMVVDGYDEKGKSGALLSEMQKKMQNLGVQDAYTLDGGGSSSLIFKGRVVNNPSDGHLRQLPTHFLFFK